MKEFAQSTVLVCMLYSGLNGTFSGGWGGWRYTPPPLSIFLGVTPGLSESKKRALTLTTSSNKKRVKKKKKNKSLYVL